MPPKIKADMEVDLHGLTVEAALRRVSALIQRKDLPRGMVIRIIHGHSNSGEDSIRHQLSRMLTGPWMRYLQDQYPEPRNPGATLIVLESP